MGFLHFAKNYSESFTNLYNGELDYEEEATIQVHLDQSNSQKILYIKKEILDAFERFSVKLAKACNQSERAGKVVPFDFKAAHGVISFDMRATLVPGFVIS